MSGYFLYSLNLTNTRYLIVQAHVTNIICNQIKQPNTQDSKNKWPQVVQTSVVERKWEQANHCSSEPFFQNFKYSKFAGN